MNIAEYVASKNGESLIVEVRGLSKSDVRKVQKKAEKLNLPSNYLSCHNDAYLSTNLNVDDAFDKWFLDFVKSAIGEELSVFGHIESGYRKFIFEFGSVQIHEMTECQKSRLQNWLNGE
jgi:hypothetical protein